MPGLVQEWFSNHQTLQCICTDILTKQWSAHKDSCHIANSSDYLKGCAKPKVALLLILQSCWNFSFMASFTTTLCFKIACSCATCASTVPLSECISCPLDLDCLTKMVYNTGSRQNVHLPIGQGKGGVRKHLAAKREGPPAKRSWHLMLCVLRKGSQNSGQ